ncbi:MAG TPA: SDR family oxidoreductase [Pseudonocardia sp.]|jgi:NAD(P)-dependent dehydrogenase (short-subunit alcohol dehydrogenase family)
MTDPFDLHNRTALVTGASRGIGARIAETLAGRGAQVLCAGRDAEALDRVVAAIQHAGGQAKPLTADLSDRDEVVELASAAGAVDILVNNAGTGDKYIPLTAADDAHWDTTFAVNFFAPMLLTREVGRGMAERGRGSILNISSIAGQWAMPLMGAYTCAKAALESLTRMTALELGPRGVRCNTIAPGVVVTELSASFLTGPVLDFFQSQTPLGRLGSVDEVANVALFLASDASSYLNGQTITLDGGTLAGNTPLSAALAALRG